MSRQLDSLRIAARRRSSNRGQSGFTLLEAIVGMGLTSTVIIALAAGLLTSIRSSDAARSTQEMDAALSAFAENLKASPPAGCDTVSSEVGGYEATTSSPRSWDESTGGWETCDPSNRPIRLDITVSDSSGSNVTGQVVVGAP
jgi:type II secretory pathway pseudopilin PulG